MDTTGAGDAVMTSPVGRDAQLAEVAQLLDAAVAGRGGARAICGDPGAGKTTLLAEVERRWQEMPVLRTRGVAAEAVLPFSGIQQLVWPIRGLLAHLPEPQSIALEAALGLKAAPGGTDRYLVSLATLSVVSEAAADKPVLILVDDFPWLDAGSQDVLLFVCRRLAAEPIAAVLASRTEDWVEVGDPGVPVVELAPLASEDVAGMVRERRAIEAHRDVVRRLASMAAGNPLAVVELINELSADQLVGRDPLPPYLPVTPNLERTFAERVGKLAADVQAVLVVVAADDSGRPRVIRAALDILGLDASGLDICLERGLLIDRSGLIDFRHPLIRSTVYGRAAGLLRQQVHAALATVLTGDEPERAVWHRAAAADGRDGEIATELAGVAARARARGAYEDAMSAWERAADMHPDPTAAADAVIAAAEAGWAAGKLDRALVDLGRLDLARITERQRAEAGWIRGGIELASGDALRAYRTLVAAAGQLRGDEPERALLILNIAAEAGSLANARTSTADLERHAAALDAGSSVRSRLLHAALLGFAADFDGDVDEAVQHLRQAVDLASGVDDPVLHLIAGRAAIYCGNDDAAHRLHLAVVEDARRRGSVDLIPIAAPRLATAELLLGRWSSAAATAAESSRLADETGQILLAPHGRATLAILAALRGDEAQMEAHLAEALLRVTDRPMGLIEDDAHWARGLLALGRGSHLDALTYLQRITHPVVQLFSTLDRAEVAAKCAQSQLEEWTEPIVPLARPDGPAWARARHAYTRALGAGHEEGALRHYEAAVEAASESGRPFERARIELGAGAYLRRHRRRADARPLLRSAASTFDRLGAQPWAERARSELRASGETVARHAAPASAQLTPQELQVARTVAEGYSNKEVAARLFLSPRTVEFHLRNVFAKLDVTSRAQLARIPLEDLAAPR